MLDTPLHHCYLVPARNVASCLKTLENELGKMLAIKTDSPLSIERSVVDTFTIELARELRQRGQQRATGEIRCLVYGFDTITIEAQNALLKIIENPAEGIHFFFVTPSVSDLLETVRSRSWLLSGLCGEVDTSALAAIVEQFLAAEGLAERLRVTEEIGSKEELRMLVELLARENLPHENRRFGQALEMVADYSRDSGASLKTLGQYLAVAASSTGK